MIFPTGLTEDCVGTTLLGVIKNLAFPTSLYLNVRADMAMLESNQEITIRVDKVRQRYRHGYKPVGKSP